MLYAREVNTRYELPPKMFSAARRIDNDAALDKVEFRW